MVHHTQNVKNATFDWFRADGSHMVNKRNAVNTD